jgi:hypothetical protein
VLLVTVLALPLEHRRASSSRGRVGDAPPAKETPVAVMRGEKGSAIMLSFPTEPKPHDLHGEEQEAEHEEPDAIPRIRRTAPPVCFRATHNRTEGREHIIVEGRDGIVSRGDGVVNEGPDDGGRKPSFDLGGSAEEERESEEEKEEWVVEERHVLQLVWQ